MTVPVRHSDGDDPVGELADGTVHYSPIGEMEVSADRARCHLCGDWYRSVGTHLRAHGWDRARYREAFGLMRRQSLEGETTRDRRATALRRRRTGDPRIRAGCELGRRWVDTGALSRAAAESARGRRHPEQRRRETARTLAAVPVRVRAEATSRASVARLRAVAEKVARDAGHECLGDLVRDRVAHGASLATLSREAGLHKDWLCRHLATVDPDAARDVARLVTGPRPVRHDAGVLRRIAATGFDDVGAFLRDRHLDRHHTVRAIAAEIGVSRPSVEAAMIRHGIPRTAHADARRRNAERAGAVAAAFGFDDLGGYLGARRAAGLSWRRIADECGEPATWLRRRAGLPH